MRRLVLSALAIQVALVVSCQDLGLTQASLAASPPAALLPLVQPRDPAAPPEHPGPAAPPQAPAAPVQQLAVFPREVLLDHRLDSQGITVQAFAANGTSRDVLGDATVTIKDPALCAFALGRFVPLKDGATTAVVSYGGKQESVAITVRDVLTEKPVSFNLDVMPIFTKAGCNSGGCHGSSGGQDRFRLSLYGFDAKGDWTRLVTEFPGRRVNLAVPADSMLLAKATKAVPHSGGELFAKGSGEYNAILAWLAQGAPRDPADVKKAVRLELFPPETILQGHGQQRISVRVTYSDGSDRDVTGQTTFITSDAAVGAVDAQGLLKNKDGGEAHVMARYGSLTALTHLISLPENAPVLGKLAAANYIDELVNDKLAKLRVQPSGLCSDEAFLRRAFIDVIARLPEEEDHRAFLADHSADKRAKLVERLLQRPEFIDLWVMKWAELIQIRTKGGFTFKSTLIYYNWLRRKLTENVPIDRIVTELLTSTGRTYEQPSANYFQIERDVTKRAENVAQVFMGTRIQCAQCHNHPFDRWTQDEYFSFAAFFAQVDTKGSDDHRALVVHDNPYGYIRHPLTNTDVTPAYLGDGRPIADDPARSRREVFAAWLTAKDNPYFARNLANRVWEQFFGRGIVNPVDDARLSNPPANPALLAALAAKLVEYGYDYRRLIRDVCTSRTYQLDSATTASNAADVSQFSHAALRRMRSEVLLDAISQVTRTEDHLQAGPLGTRAVQIVDGVTSDYFLKTFGRTTRESVCSCEVRREPNLSQALHLLNGPTVDEKIRKGGLVEEALKAGQSPEAIIRRLYVRCLGREVGKDELAKLLPTVAGDQPREPLEDVFWALLNSKEFLFVH